MGDQLIKYYHYINEQLGLSGKVKLAQLTKVPSTVAATEPDKPELVQRFKDAITQITGKPPPP